MSVRHAAQSGPEVSTDGRRHAVVGARSFLFVPGDRPDRFPKAHASGADVVILDLEDAVAADGKEAALAPVVGWASAHERCVVRLNGVGTAWIDSELDALHRTGIGIMLPKSESAEDLLR